MYNNITESLKSLRENTTYIEFDDILNSVKAASDLGDLDRYLDSVQFMMNVEGLNPASAFQKAFADLDSES
jgi:hypothetical protein